MFAIALALQVTTLLGYGVPALGQSLSENQNLGALLLIVIIAMSFVFVVALIALQHAAFCSEDAAMMREATPDWLRVLNVFTHGQSWVWPYALAKSPTWWKVIGIAHYVYLLALCAGMFFLRLDLQSPTLPFLIFSLFGMYMFWIAGYYFFFTLEHLKRKTGTAT